MLTPRILITACTILVATPLSAQDACDIRDGIEPLYLSARGLVNPTDRARAEAEASAILKLTRGSAVDYLDKLGVSRDSEMYPDVLSALTDLIALARTFDDGARLTKPMLQRNRMQNAVLASTLKRLRCDKTSSRGLVGYADPGPRSGSALESARRMAERFAKGPAWQKVLVIAALIVGLALLARAIHGSIQRAGFRRYVYVARVGAVEDAENKPGFTLSTVDISRGGLKVRTAPQLQEIDRLIVHLDGRKLRTRVQWTNAHFIGLTFPEPLSRTELHEILREYGRHK